MKVESTITKCYLVEVVIDNVNTYYKSEYVFGTYQEAKELKKKMIEEANLKYPLNNR